MKRLELFEFEDFNWLPKAIRTGVTNLLKVFHRVLGTDDVLTEIIQKCQQKIPFSQIVDLGSGSGGPMINVIERVNQSNLKGQSIGLLLSDKYPNSTVVKRINNLNLSNIRYLSESVDASKIEKAPKGLKTMIASFHHMPPEVAKQILQSAQKNKEPILIYELAENTIPIVLWWLLLPISLLVLMIMALVLTPFVRPFSFSQLVLTYLLPIIPIVYAWDGQASIMRTYTFSDIEELIGEQTDEYTWEIQQVKNKKGKKAGYSVFGYAK